MSLYCERINIGQYLIWVSSSSVRKVGGFKENDALSRSLNLNNELETCEISILNNPRPRVAQICQKLKIQKKYPLVNWDKWIWLYGFQRVQKFENFMLAIGIIFKTILTFGKFGTAYRDRRKIPLDRTIQFVRRTWDRRLFVSRPGRRAKKWPNKIRKRGRGL